uniref:Salivary gland metalloprotease, putative n=1 Tax=Ixodes scapularis TaxID=6945 RepID=A0A1S4KYE0_IXOSC
MPVEEVVYPRILEARGLNGEKMLYVRDGLTLSLEKSTVFSESFVFSEHDGEKQYDRTVSGKDLENNLYHNIKHGSSLLVDESNGKVQVRGLLSDLLSIEPLLAAEEADNGAVAHKISKLDKSQIRLDDSGETHDRSATLVPLYNI